MSFLTSSRFWLAGPFCLIVAVLCLLGMAAWFPAGVGKINNIIMPLVMFPLIWAVLFFYSYLSQQLKVAWAVLGTIAVVHVGILYLQFTSGGM